MSEQEFLARDLALRIEINEKQSAIEQAYQTIWGANVDITHLQAERIKLRQQYYKSKQGGQNND